MLGIFPDTGNIAINTVRCFNMGLRKCALKLKKQLLLSWGLWEGFTEVMFLYILTEVEVCQGWNYQAAKAMYA